ncbi:Neuron navigator 2 [Schistosoma japonicum]|nr:Neuron navigator 2 [Schistosoma japonicum]
MERFYPNFYSYTKSHYEPLVSSLLIKSESDHNCKSDVINNNKIHSNDNNINGIHEISCDWYNDRNGKKYSENSNLNEQQNTILSSNINHQNIQTANNVKQSRGQSVGLTLNDSQRWIRENSDPPRHNKLTEDEMITNIDPFRSVQSFVMPYTKINEHLTYGHKVKQNAKCRNTENEFSHRGSVSHNDIRCNIIPNYQHHPDLMSTSLTKYSSSSIKRKSRSLHKQSSDKGIHCTNHIGKNDSNTVFTNVNHLKRLPSPCVRLKNTLETDTNSNILPGCFQNPTVSHYDLRPKRLIETERMVRQELASARQKSATYNNHCCVSTDDYKLTKQTSPRSLKKTCFNDRKQIIQLANKGKYIMSDKKLSGNESQVNNSTILINNGSKLSSNQSENISIISSEVNREDKIENHETSKDNTIETLEETMENLLFRIEQLQALDNLKSSEIHELQSIINQLRGDDLNSKSLANSPSHFNPRPPRSTSCRTLPDAMYQDLQDAISLSSFTSGTSGGSQEPSMHLLQQQHQNQQQQIISNNDSKCSSHIVNSSPSASDNERSNTKHSRWLRASFSKAFRKKTKCNIPVNDSEILMNHSTTTSLQPTLPDQISMNSPKSQYEQQLERLHLTVSRMRWQMDLLEARNKKLQEIILKYNRDEILLHELYTITPERKVTLHDLLTHYCQNASQTAQVFVSAESLYQNSLDKSLTKGQNRNHLNVNTDNAKDTPLNCIRSFKIGCIGVSDNMSWEELDERLHKLIQYCIDFLDPNNQLQLESLDLRTYQLNFTFTEQCEIKTHNVVRCLTATTLSSSTNDNQSQMPCTVLLPTLYAGKQISSESPIMWINDMINKSNAKHYTISIQVHLKGGTMKFPLERNQKVFERNEMLKYVCFGSLIPMTTLNTYLSIINDNLVVIISGPSGTGKSNLVNELAKLLVKDPYNTNAIYNFWFKHDGSTTLKELKEILTQQLHSYTNHGYPEVINLLNIHYFQESLCDALSAVKYSSNCPKIIGTSGYGNTELEKVCINSQIKIINHLSDVNDAKDYLERSLNRKLLQYRLFSRFYSLHGFNEDKDALNEFLTQAEDKNLYQLVSWLLEFWNQLNEIPHSLIQTSQFTVFGIRAFLTCPMHSQLSLNWFLDLWNNMLVPILFKDIKYVTVSSTPVTTIASEKLSNISKTLNNFLGWITTTWPWNPTIVNFPTSIKEPKITLTQNSVPVIKNIQPVLSTLSSSDIEICQHRTSMDSGIILDGINPTNFNFFNGFENNSNMLYSNYYYNHYYYYPYGIGENFDTQQDTIITSDFNQLNPTSYRYQNARNNCSKTVTSMN